jgi:hypothetical protein
MLNMVDYSINFEGNYKSFKKVQLFILNSVQGVYESAVLLTISTGTQTNDNKSFSHG